MTSYIFKTPIVREGITGAGRLMSFFTQDVGISVVKANGIYLLKRYMLDSDASSFQETYLGGRNHTVSEDTKTALIAGGVGVTEDNFTAI